MLILALDTSSPAGSIALLRDCAVLASHKSAAGEPYSASILRDTKALLHRTGISLEEIDLIAIDAGPGSFTGLRVGLTTVKGWAEVWQKPIAPVSGLEAMAAQVEARVCRGRLAAAVMDARRGQVFGAIFRRRSESGSLDRVGEEVLATADGFLESLRETAGGEGFIIACSSLEVIGPTVEEKDGSGCEIRVVSAVLAPTIGQIAYEKGRRGEVVDALHLDANYIRRSDAEMKWTSQ
jgi:tRNA threonylcarbamoyladenosine biosynthesis protein TsaB